MEDPGGALFHYYTIWTLLFLVLSGAFITYLKTALSLCAKSKLRAMAEGEDRKAGRKPDRKYGELLSSVEKWPCYRRSLKISLVFIRLLSGCIAGAGIFGPLSAALAGLGLGEAGSGALALLIAAFLTAFLFILFGEVIARHLAAAAPETSSAVFLPLIKIIVILSFPLAAIAALLSSLIEKLPSPQNGAAQSKGMTEEELHMALLEGEKSGIVESQERTMVEGVFYLGDRPVGVFMVHRSEFQWLDINADAEETRKTLEAAGDQRYFPVAGDSLDEVSGMVSAEAILKALLAGSWPGLADVMRPPYFVPETMPAIKAFEAFKKADADCLFVMDEYGGFAGLLTVRNLIEEIVGELSPSLAEGEEIKALEGGGWLADGSVNIDDAAGAIKLDGLGEGQSEYHTLAGFILSLAGEIPLPGASFEYKGYVFKIVEMDGNRIEKVSITLKREA